MSLYCPELQLLQSLISEGYSKDSIRLKEASSIVTTNERNQGDFKARRKLPSCRASEALLRADKEL